MSGGEGPSVAEHFEILSDAELSAIIAAGEVRAIRG